MLKKLLDWAKKVHEYKTMTDKDIADKRKKVEDKFAERCRNWCDKHHAVLEEIFAYGSYSFTAMSVAAWRIFSLKVAKINTSYRFTLSTGVEVEMSVRGSVSHPQFARDYCYNMDSSGCVWVRVLSGTEIILTEAALAKMTNEWFETALERVLKKVVTKVERKTKKLRKEYGLVP